jgi:hypothetical protein
MRSFTLDSLSAWRLDHAWMQDSETRPIADDLAIADARAADGELAGVPSDDDATIGLTRPADVISEDDDATR